MTSAPPSSPIIAPDQSSGTGLLGRLTSGIVDITEKVTSKAKNALGMTPTTMGGKLIGPKAHKVLGLPKEGGGMTCTGGKKFKTRRHRKNHKKSKKHMTRKH